MFPRYPVTLTVDCQTDDGLDGVFEVKCDFRTQDNFDRHDGTFFDHLIERINEFLEKAHPGYYVDGTIETRCFDFEGGPDIFAPMI